ncbi:MAG: hypothetical protein ABH896_04585 [Candidatus Jacksonbacteria bacterium]
MRGKISRPYLIADDENYTTYGQLIKAVNAAEPDILTKAKGFYADGELGLVDLLIGLGCWAWVFKKV